MNREPIDADLWMVCRQRRTIDRRLNCQLRSASNSEVFDYGVT
jgi:hypothetical protein